MTNRCILIIIYLCCVSQSMFIRKAKHAGSWYEKHTVKLRQQLEEYLSRAEKQNDIAGSQIKAMIGPHAGYMYSGPNAAWGYQYLQAMRPKRVLLLGCSHYYEYDSVSISKASELETPIGNLPVDMEICQELRNNLPLKHEDQNKLTEEREHSLEMHMPYLRLVLPQETKIIPVMVGALSLETTAILGRYFQSLFLDKDTVCVVSTDFCHWGDNYNYKPYEPKYQGEPIWEYIRRLDQEAYELISALDIDGFFKYLQRTGNNLCGGAGPVKLLMSILKQANLPFKTKWVKLDSSDKATTQEDNSVSYATAMIYL